MLYPSGIEAGPEVLYWAICCTVTPYRLRIVFLIYDSLLGYTVSSYLVL